MKYGTELHLDQICNVELDPEKEEEANHIGTEEDGAPRNIPQERSHVGVGDSFDLRDRDINPIYVQMATKNKGRSKS